MLYASFPPVGVAALVWVALVPLLALVEWAGLPWWVRYGSAWAGGLVFWVGSLVWIWELHPSAWLGWVVLGVYQSLFWPVFLGAARAIRRVFVLPLVVAAPVAWVGVDYIQAHLLSGFPWYYLAHAQYANLPLIQVADLGGAWVVTGLIVVAQVGVLRGLEAIRGIGSGWGVVGRRLRTPAVAAGLVAASLGYGWWRLGSASFEPGARVALLQSNLKQELKQSLDAEKILEIFAGLITEAHRRAEARGEAIDLYVWPETSFPYGYVWIEPGLSGEAGERAARQLNPTSTLAQWVERERFVREQLRTWVDVVGSPMLVGTLFFELTSRGATRTNVALWLEPGQENPRIYRKLHLVPFGEYIPLLDILPWIRRLAPYDETTTPRLVAGDGPRWFDYRGIRYAPTICFEDTLPHLTRRFFREMPDGKVPDVIVDQSNDGWFDGTAEHDLHLASAVFRCVELRAPLVRAVNMGYSAAIDGNGRIVAIQPKRTEGTLVARLPLDGRSSLYAEIGDLLGQVCLIGAIVAVKIRLLLAFCGRSGPYLRNVGLGCLPGRGT
jgi:apolipoprotein N-acyltransferase